MIILFDLDPSCVSTNHNSWPLLIWPSGDFLDQAERGSLLHLRGLYNFYSRTFSLVFLPSMFMWDLSPFIASWFSSQPSTWRATISPRYLPHLCMAVGDRVGYRSYGNYSLVILALIASWVVALHLKWRW